MKKKTFSNKKRKWFIAWALESFTTEHTCALRAARRTQGFFPSFLRELCGEKLTSPLSHPLPKKREGGQSLVELAISLTVILLLLSGAVTFGMAYFSFLAVNDAAQEGAVYGSLAPQDQTGIAIHVQNASSNPVNFSQFVYRPMSDCNSGSGNYICVSYTNGITKDCQGTSSGKTNAITVTVTYRYQIFMPFIGAVIGSNAIPLSASATNIILTPQCP